MINKRWIIVVLLALLPALAACQSATDARSQFCAGLRDLEPAVTQLVEGKDIANAGQLKQQLVIFRDSLSLVVSQAAQISNLSLDNLIQSLEAYEAKVKALPDDMPMPQVKASVGDEASKFRKSYDDIAGAVCAAK